MAEKRYYATLGCISFGLAVGIAGAVLVFLLGTAASIFGWGVALAMTLASVFVGFGPTLVGSIAGAVWAFASGFFVGLLIAWLYNRLLLRRGRHML